MYLACSSLNSVKCASNVGRWRLATYSSEHAIDNEEFSLKTIMTKYETTYPFSLAVGTRQPCNVPQEHWRVRSAPAPATEGSFSLEIMKKIVDTYILRTQQSYLRRRSHRHDKGWHRRAAQVHQPAFGQEDHPLAVRPDDVIHLRTHLLPGQVGRSKTILYISDNAHNSG